MILLLAVCAAAGAYQLLALIACVVHLRRRDRLGSGTLPISMLKPVYGADDEFYRAIVSHARIAYPTFEIVFGVPCENDSTVPFIRRLQAEYPDVAIRIVQCSTKASNRKVGSLIDLARAANYPLLVVNDSDIVVEPDYLHKVTAPLEEDAEVGLVTCLYRAGADSFASKWEALGIATDFAPSALVAPFLGVKEFGLGSTLALRKADLQAIGGFEAFGDYIADDYQLGKRISHTGKRVVLTRMPVETHLGSGSWKGVWGHQVRWARTIRLSRGAYLGLPVANASFWAVLALAAGLPWVAVALLGLRMAVAACAAIFVLHDPQFPRMWPLTPLRDLWGFAVWCAGAVGQKVIWRGRRLRLDRQGRITSIQ